MSEARRFAMNYVFMVAGSLLNFGVGAATMLLLGWGLSVADFGTFSYALSLTGFMALIAQAGTSQYAIAFIPRHRDRAGELVASAMGLRTVMLLPMMLALFAAALLAKSTPSTLALVMVLGLANALNLYALFGKDLCQAVERNNQGAIVVLCRAAGLMAAVTGWYYLHRGDMSWLAWLWVLAHLPAVAAGTAVIGSNVAPVGLSLNPSAWWRILRHSGIFALIGLFTVPPGVIETILLKSFLGQDTEQVGYYQIAVRLMMLSAVGAFSVVEVFRPIVSRKYAESPEAFENTVRRLHKFTFMTAVPCLVFVAVFAREILGFLFDTKYLPATPLVWAMAGAFMITCCPPLWAVFHMTDLPRLSLRIGLVTVVAIAAGSILLVPRYGMHGAAAVSVMAAAFGKAQTLIYWRRRRYPRMGSLRPYAGAAGVTSAASLACWLLKPTVHIVGLAAIFGVLVAAGTVWLVMDRSDRQALCSVAQGLRDRLRRDKA